jgi:hypothetical protein|tara:strand:- start:1414 stop:1623 length:210 start_codon:yes stop_codon:yes gene_type:complete
MSKRYLVNVEVDEGEWMYATAENPFTYHSKPLIFETKGEAEAHLLRYNNAHVEEQADIKPKQKKDKYHG